MIITIAGRYGCGAKAIAKKLASDLDYTIYDDEIVTAAYETGESYLDKSALRYYDDSNSDASVDELDARSVSGESNDDMPYDVLPLDLRLNAAMQGALNRLADQDNCIFVGKCANYYLRNRKNAIILFVTDSEKNKIARIMKERSCDASVAKQYAEKTDRRREDFYTYFTGEKWDDARNYDLCVNTGLLGEDGTARLIRALVNIKEKQL